MGLYFDKAYVKRSLEVRKQAFEKRKELAGKMAGPAVIEIFGETPFEPERKKEAIALSEEQQLSIKKLYAMNVLMNIKNVI